MATTGKIIQPKHRLVRFHELRVAEILASLGDGIFFIPESTCPKPDIIRRGVEWEIKSPTGKSNRTIENNIRNALNQSGNIIIDLQRIKIPEDKCVKEVQKQVSLSGNRIKRMVIIKKNQEIITIK